jgi:histidinol-phosphate/aromatic aminotransferase/cobyric acid decarboxylase-like protein
LNSQIDKNSDVTDSEVKYVSSLYGGFWDLDVKDFCYMTNPYFPPEEFLTDLGARLQDLIKAYPSTNWHISSLLAKPLGLTQQELIVANGASELISTITGRFVKNLAVPVPTFNEYINRAEVQGKSVSPFVTSGDFELDPKAFIQHVKSTRANSALLIQPNNPTGTFISKENMRYLLESLRSLDLILVDESFIEFVHAEPNPSVVDLIFEYPNLIILKSLSKNYGIPGLRLGYAVSGNQERVADLRQDLPIWNINSLAQFFLEKMPDYQEQFYRSCELLKSATQRMYSGLQDIPYLKPYPTQGNFVLCRILYGFNASELTAHLFNRHRILVNNCGGKEGLEDSFLRIACRTEEENAELLEALSDLERLCRKGDLPASIGGIL